MMNSKRRATTGGSGQVAEGFGSEGFSSKCSAGRPCRSSKAKDSQSFETAARRSGNCVGALAIYRFIFRICDKVPNSARIEAAPTANCGFGLLVSLPLEYTYPTFAPLSLGD